MYSGHTRKTAVVCTEHRQGRNSVQCAHAGGGCSLAHIRTAPRQSLGYLMVVFDSSRLISMAVSTCCWMGSSASGAFRDMKVWR